MTIWGTRLVISSAVDWSASPSDPDLQRRALTVIGGHRRVCGHPARREHTHGPGPRGGEETEPAVLAKRNLGDELSVVVEQPGISGRRRCPVARYVALDDGLARCAGGHGDTSGGCSAALLCLGRLLGRRCCLPGLSGGLGRVHRASPSSMGTPTSDPYSVQDPS